MCEPLPGCRSAQALGGLGCPREAGGCHPPGKLGGRGREVRGCDPPASPALQAMPVLEMALERTQEMRSGTRTAAELTRTGGR